MSYPLAVFGTGIGDVAETFIRRHMVDLLPGGTVVMVETGNKPNGVYWSVPGPVLALDDVQSDYLGTVTRFLVEHGVRTFLGEYLDVSLPWLSLTQKLGIRFFGHAHGYDVSERLRDPKTRADYMKFRSADGIITVSQLSRSMLIDLGLAAEKIHVVPCGVEVPANAPRRPQRELIRCLVVSRMVAVKGPIFVLDAFRRATEVNPDLRLDFIGSGPLLPAARQYCQVSGLEDRAVLHGAQPHGVVRQMMAGADIFLQHSLLEPDTGAVEGLPVAILEAMACGLPVVATLHGGIPEAVADDATGYLVREGDTQGMADRIVALARSEELRRRLGEGGWLAARERFSWESERTALFDVLGLDATASGAATTGDADDRGVRKRRPSEAVTPGAPHGVDRASIVADPNPIRIFDDSGVGITTLTWNARQAELVEVHVGSPNGPLFSRSGPVGASVTGKWVRNGMTFYLQDVSGEKPLDDAHTLASLTVHVMRRDPS